MWDAIEGILKGVGTLFRWWGESMAPPEDDYYRLTFPNGEWYKFRTWLLSFLPSGAVRRYIDGKFCVVFFSINLVDFLESGKKVVEVAGWEGETEVNLEKEEEEFRERVGNPVRSILAVNTSLVYHLPLVTLPTRDALLEVIRSLADAYHRLPYYSQFEKWLREAGVRPFINEVVFWKNNPYWEWITEEGKGKNWEEWKEVTAQLIRSLGEGKIDRLLGFEDYEVRNLGLFRVEPTNDWGTLKLRFIEAIEKFVNEKNEEFLSYVERKKKENHLLYPDSTYPFITLDVEDLDEFIRYIFYASGHVDYSKGINTDRLLFPLLKWKEVIT